MPAPPAARSGATCRRSSSARRPSMYAVVPICENKTCPGVRRLLYGLKRRGVPVGLVTGNLTRIGWKKMKRAELDHYFQFGVFAEMAPDRAELARMAIAQRAPPGLDSMATPASRSLATPRATSSPRGPMAHAPSPSTPVSRRAKNWPSFHRTCCSRILRALRIGMLV